MNRSACALFAIAVRVSSGINVSSDARVDNLRAQPVVQQLAQPQRHIQHHILLLNATRAQRARVVPTMPRVDHDPPDLQPQRPHQRRLTIRRRWRRLAPESTGELAREEEADSPVTCPLLREPFVAPLLELVPAARSAIGCDVGRRVASIFPG